MISPRESLYLGHLGPIPLFVHWSALVMVVMTYNWTQAPGAPFDAGSFIIALIVLIMGIVLHELGHGLTAKALGAFGVTITLWAFGGLCSSTRDALPRRELLIIAAGPIVSFILAGLGYLGLHGALTYHPEWLIDDRGPSTLYLFLSYTYGINLIMGIFNSLPIYPLDGGQVVYNLVLGISGKRDLANRMSLFLAVVGALGYLLYRMSLNDYRFDDSLTYPMVMMGFLVYNAFLYLR